MFKALVATLPLALVGCHAQKFTDQPMTEWRDGDTEYAFDEHDDGFTLYVFHSRFQFFKSSERIAATGRDALEAIAEEIAEENNKEIEPIKKSKIKSEIGRSGWDVTSWSAMVRVYYKKKG